MYCSESFPLEAYDYWMGVKNNAWVIGDFVWTSFDYIGEASIGWRGYMQERDFYPWTLAFCGDIDICGWKRPQSYYRDVLWTNDNRVSIFVTSPQPSFPINPKRESWSIWHWNDVVSDWNWQGQENKNLDVHVYSSCEAVELFLNGKSLGKKPTNNSTRFTSTWSVPYQSGELKAIGYVGQKKVTTTQLRSANTPPQIKLSADKVTLVSDGQSLSYITVELLDANGVLNPRAENLMKFEIDGPGKIVAVASSNPMSVESFQQLQRKAWQGRCLVIVKSDTREGDIKLKAVTEGLPASEIILKVIPNN
jgi:beta-galactosidase